MSNTWVCVICKVPLKGEFKKCCKIEKMTPDSRGLIGSNGGKIFKEKRDVTRRGMKEMWEPVMLLPALTGTSC